MKMSCTGSPGCGDTRCYHFKPHDEIPYGEIVPFCTGPCFDGAVCRPVDAVDEALDAVAKSAGEMAKAIVGATL